MRDFRKGFLLLLLILVLALVACGGEVDDTSKDETEENEISSGGDLKYASTAQPLTLDPVITTATITSDIGRHIFETLVTVDSSYDPVPMLAESWEESDDGLTYTFHLREGVMFHNGNEMLAEDVVTSMNRWLENSSTAEALISGATFEEEDKYTVELHLEEPSGLTMSALSGSLQFPAIMPKEVTDTETGSGVEEFIGTGPFKFVEWKQDQHVQLERFDDYSPVDLEADGLSGKKEALLDNLFFEFVKDGNTQLSGMQTGEYDIGYGFDPDNFDQLNDTENVKATDPIIGQYAVVFNKSEGIFTDVKMRQALAYGLDLEEIAEAGLSEHRRMESSYMQIEQTDWASDAGEEKYNDTNLDKAKELLDEAGYDGEPIRLIASREYSFLYDSSVVIQEQLKEIGMDIELEVYDWPTLVNKREDPTEFEIFLTGFPTTITPLEQLFFNDNWDDGPNDDKTDELLAEISAAETIEEASKKWDELQGHSWEVLPIVKISDYTMIVGIRSNVEGFEIMDGPILWNTKFTD